MDSFMKSGSSTAQREHETHSAREGGMVRSPSQDRHLNCIIVPMKVLLVTLLIASSVHAQSIADVARKERERQTKLRPTRVFSSIQPTKTEEPKPAIDAANAAEKTNPPDAQAVAAPESSKEPLKPLAPPAFDPVQVWNNQLNQLRAKIRALQDQELALLLQENQVTNQVYATVTDPVTQEHALLQLGQVQQQLANVRKDLDEARKTLDLMLLQGPPKK